MNAAAVEKERPAEAPALPASLAELSGRLVICISCIALLYAFWTPRLEDAAGWVSKEMRVLPRMSVFVLSALAALILQGARPARQVLLACGALALGGGLFLMPLAELWDLSAPKPAPAGAASLMSTAGPALNLLRFELSVFAAILLGARLGREVRTGAHFVTLLLCAVAGDVWLSSFHVPESVDVAHPLRLLRVPWPPASGSMGLSPAFTDLLFLSAAFEAGRGLRFHTLSLALGAVSGYCAGSFLGLEPWPAWPALSMLMFTSGVVVSCWPELKCDARETGRGLLIAALLLAGLLGITRLHDALHPSPEPPMEMRRHPLET